MKRIFALMAAAIVFLFAGQQARAEVITPVLAYGDAVIEKFEWGYLHCIEVRVTAEVTGAHTGEVSDILIPIDINGILLVAETDPGTTSPTAAYDLTITNYGLDLFGAALNDRSATATEREQPTIPGVPVKGYLTLTTANQSVSLAQFAVRIFYYDTRK